MQVELNLRRKAFDFYRSADATVSTSQRERDYRTDLHLLYVLIDVDGLCLFF